jgi:hypothetical protein
MARQMVPDLFAQRLVIGDGHVPSLGWAARSENSHAFAEVLINYSQWLTSPS